MKRPSFQFYPADWRSNSKLRRCSFRERGVWLEVMGLMHDSDEYGVLRWPLREIVDAIGCKPADLDALRARNVMKGTESGRFDGLSFRPMHGRKLGDPVVLIAACDGPIYFSSRMVEDEYKRLTRGVGTRFGDDKSDSMPSDWNAQKRAPTRREGDGPTSSSSPSPSENHGVASQPLSGKPDPEPVNGREAKGRALANEARGILQFLNERAGKRFPPTDSNVGIIVARLREGFEPGQIRQVVAMKIRKWKGDENMAEFLRPATLFGRTNFSNYVGELVDAPDDQIGAAA